jgi:hypothetical protein
MVDSTDPRIGHTERDHATELLREAAGDGRIDLDELDVRLERVFSARTQSELAAVLADLGSTEASGPGPSVPRSGHSADDPLVLDPGDGTLRRRGRWELPPWVRIGRTSGSVWLDCRSAVVRSDVVEVDLVRLDGTVRMVVPTGWAANTDHLRSGSGTVRNRLPALAAYGCPTLVLRGSISAGTLILRHATVWERRLDRHL